MAISATLDEVRMIAHGEAESIRENKPFPRCPRCSKELIVEKLSGEARVIHCKDDRCIRVVFRGL